MKRKESMMLAMFAIFLVVFNVVFFVSGGSDREASVWVAYAFIHISFVAIMLTAYVAMSSGKMTEITIPALSISVVYFFSTFVVGLFFIIASLESVKGCVVINVILLGLYLIVFLAIAMADDATSRNVETMQANRIYVKECTSNLKAIMERVNNKEIYKKIEKVYDFIQASPIKSDDQVMEYEIEVMRLIRVLEKNVEEQNAEEIEKTANSIMRNAEDRNRCLMNSW